MSNKKRIFTHNPEGYSYGIYTYLDENMSVDFYESDSLPENYDKFARRDLYTVSEGHILNEKIIETMQGTDSENYLRYAGGTFIRFDELELTRRPNIPYGIKDVSLKVYMFSLYGLGNDPARDDTLGVYDDTPNRNPYKMIEDGVGGWIETGDLKTWDEYTADLWRTGTEFENRFDPGEIARVAHFAAPGAGQNPSDSTGKLYQFNNAVLVSNLNRGKNVPTEYPISAIFPNEDIDGQVFNPNYKSAKYDQANVSEAYVAEQGYRQIGAFNINPIDGANLDTNQITQLFQEDGVYNPIYVVVAHKGDASVPGPSNDYYRKDRIQTFKINPSDLFNFVDNTPTGKLSFFEFRESDSLIIDQEGSQGAVAQTVSSLKMTINTGGVDTVDLAEEYSKYLEEVKVAQPLINLFDEYDTSDTLDSRIIYLNPSNEIFFSKNDSNYKTAMNDYTPFSKLSLINSEKDLQVYYENEMDRIEASAPAKIQLDFGIGKSRNSLSNSSEVTDDVEALNISDYSYYVIDWDDQNNKYESWDDVLNDYPSSVSEFLEKRNENLYKFAVVNKTSLTHSYNTSGIKNIKVVMFNYLKRNDGFVEPLRWKFITVRFFLDIPDYEFPDFTELGGNNFVTLPWPYTTAVIGGVSSDSKYLKSIKDTLSSGNITDSDIVEETFLIDAQKNNEIGENIEKMDLEQVRYFNTGIYDMHKLLRVSPISGEENPLDMEENELLPYYNFNYYNGSTYSRTFSDKTSVGQIFINDNIDEDLKYDCQLELNTGNLIGKSIYDSSGKLNQGFLIGDYKIKKTSKNTPMRRDSFIKVPKKDTKKGAL